MVSNQRVPWRSWTSMPSTLSPGMLRQYGSTTLASARSRRIPPRVETHSVSSRSGVSPCTSGRGSASAATRWKSWPVQRARPPRVPTHRVPSGVVARWATLAEGRLRASPGIGMKRRRRPSGCNWCRPPAEVPNQTLPSGVDAMDHTVVEPICG
ncbi:hypothetical protein NB705_003497 [Xanthomonas sacchari]|nr:hypothetical protein [Xanthomonas sacchari]